MFGDNKTQSTPRSNINSLPRIFKRHKRTIESAKIISFDIFDTLLLRPYENPSDVFLHLSTLYNTPAFFESRINAESNARVALDNTPPQLQSK